MKNSFLLLILFMMLNADIGALLLYGKFRAEIDRTPGIVAELNAEPETGSPIDDRAGTDTTDPENVIDVTIIVEEPEPDSSDRPVDDPLLEEELIEGSEGESAPAPIVPSAPANYMLADLANFRQDERGWAYDPLGHTNQTMREFGCTVTSVANAITNYDRDFVTPRILNNNLIKARGYTDRGWLKWSAITAATEGRYSARIFNSPSNANIDSCLLNNEYPIVKILLRGTVQHWVLIVGKSNGEYLIRDPLEGDRAEKPMLLSKRAKGVHSLRCIMRN